MITYKLCEPAKGNVESKAVLLLNSDGSISSIPFSIDNSDYVAFKSAINADEAELEGVDGNVMSPEAAKAYVATLP